MDRRDFIKVSGAAAAGIALTGCGPRPEKTAVPVLTPTDPSRIARDDERKIALAFHRVRSMTYGEHYLDEAILCGHCHRFYEERFSPTAMLYAVDATYHGGVQAVYFE